MLNLLITFTIFFICCFHTFMKFNIFSSIKVYFILYFLAAIVLACVLFYAFTLLGLHVLCLHFNLIVLRFSLFLVYFVQLESSMYCKLIAK